jgi:hypothetical protein
MNEMFEVKDKVYGAEPRPIIKVFHRKKRWRIIDEKRCMEVRSPNLSGLEIYATKGTGKRDEITGKTLEELFSFLPTNSCLPNGSNPTESVLAQAEDLNIEDILAFLEGKQKAYYYEDEEIVNILKMNGYDDPKNVETHDTLQELYEQDMLKMYLEGQGFKMPEQIETKVKRPETLRDACFEHLDKAGRYGFEHEQGISLKDLGMYLVNQEDVVPFIKGMVSLHLVREIVSIIHQWSTCRGVESKDGYFDLPGAKWMGLATK